MNNTTEHLTIWVRNENVPINLEYFKAKVQIIEKFFHFGQIWVIHYSTDGEDICISSINGGGKAIDKPATSNLKKDITNLKIKFFKMLADNNVDEDKMNRICLKNSEESAKNQYYHDKAINQINEYLKTIEPDPTATPT